MYKCIIINTPYSLHISRFENQNDEKIEKEVQRKIDIFEIEEIPYHIMRFEMYENKKSLKKTINKIVKLIQENENVITEKE